MAAVLACGTDAVLSHRSAAALWGLRQNWWKIDVTVPRQKKRPRPGARRSPGGATPRRDNIRDGTPVLRITDRRLRNDAAGVLDDLTALGA